MTTPTLSQAMPIVDPDTGAPTAYLVQWWSSLLKQSVRSELTPIWTPPSGPLVRDTFAAYAGQIVSASPTQAQVQAIDNATVVVSQRLAALITDLQSNGVLKT